MIKQCDLPLKIILHIFAVAMSACLYVPYGWPTVGPIGTKLGIPYGFISTHRFYCNRDGANAVGMSKYTEVP